MSKQIDERVVEMRFDNTQFESNVKTTMSTLQKFKQALNLTGAAKGLSEVGTAAKGIDLSSIGSAASTVTARFSTLGSIGFTVLSRLTNAAIDTTRSITRLVSSFGGLESAKAGFREYETQIGAVQTILANTQSKGSTLDDVNAALDELNTYADKTIYNFTEMTRNIGTFTAAGVELDKAVTSIKGIANLAAVSGSTSTQASTAMYQLSQALAAGRVSLMDWNSVVNAGMGGQLFQEALKRTARVMGKDVDAAIEKYGSFRESLTQGEWLTTEVLTETLTQLSGAYTEADLIAKGYSQDQAKEITKLADTAVNAATKVKTFTQLIDTLKEAAQSGWTQTWEYVLGDFEEAKEFFTKFSDFFGEIIGNNAEKRNKLLGGALQSNWGKLVTRIEEAGYTSDRFTESVNKTLEIHGYNVSDLIAKYGSLEKAFQSGKISGDILREAIDGLVGSTTALGDITVGLDYGAGFDGYNEDVAKVQKILKDLGYDLGEFGEKADGVDGRLGEMTQAAIRAFQEANGLEITGIVDQATIDKMNALQESSNKLATSFDDLIGEIDKLGGRQLLIESLWNVIYAIKDIADQVGKAWEEIFPPATSDQLYSIIEGIHSFTENLKLNKGTLNRVKFIFKGFFAVLHIGAKVVGAIWEAIKPLFSSVRDLGDGFLLAAANVGAWLVKLDETVDKSEILEKAIKPVVNFIKGVIDALSDFVKGIVDSFKLPDISPFIEGIKGLVESLKEMLNTPFVQQVKNFITNLKNAFGSFGTAFGGLFADILQKIADFLNSIFDPDFDISAALSKLGGDIVEAFKGFGGAIKQAIADAWNQAFGENLTFDDAVTIISETFSNFVESVKQFISKAYERIKDFFSGSDTPKIDILGMLNLPEDSMAANVISKIVGFFTSIFEGIKTAITTIYDAIKSFIEEHTVGKAIAEGLGISGSSTDENTSYNSGGGVRNQIMHTGGTESYMQPSFADKVISFFSQAFEKIRNFFSGVSEILGGIFSDIIEMFAEIGEAIKNSDGVKAFGDFFQGLAKFISGVVHVIGIALGGIGDILMNADFETLADVIKALVGAIAVLAGIRTLYNIGTLTKGASEVFEGIGEFFEKFKKKDEIKFKESFATKFLKIGASLFLVAAGMKIIASAMEDFGTMDVGTLIQAGIVITALTVLASKFVKSAVGVTNGFSAGAGILMLAIAMKVFATAIQDLGTIDPKTLLIAGVAMGVLTKFATTFVKSTKDSSKVFAAGFGILVLAAAMKMFAWAARDFAELDWENGSFVKGLSAIIALILAVSLFAKSTGSATNLMAAGFGMILLAAAMKIFASAAKDMAEVKWEDLGKLASMIGGILAFELIAGILDKSKMLGSIAKGSTIIVGIVFAIGAIVGALGWLDEKYNIKSFINGGGALLCKLAQVLQEVVNSFATLEFAGLMGVALALGLTGGVITGSIAKGALQMTAVIGLVGALVSAFGWLDQQFDISSFIADGGNIFCALGSTLQSIVNSFATLEFGAFIAVAGTLGVTGGIFGGLVAKGALQMTAVIGLVGALVSAFGWLDRQFDISSFVADGGNLLCTLGSTLQSIVNSFATLEFAGFIAVAGMLGITGGVFGGLVGKSALQMTAVIGLVGALVSAFGWLNRQFDLETFVNSGSTLFCSVGTAIQQITDKFATLEFAGFIAVAGLLGVTGGVFGGLAAKGTLQMTAVIGLIGGIIAAFGWLNRQYDLETFVNSGSTLFCSVGTAIQQIVDKFATLEFGGFIAVAGVLGVTGGVFGGLVAKGALQMTAVIGLVGALVSAFGWLDRQFDLDTFVADGGALLCSVASTLTTVIDSFATLDFLGFIGLAGILGVTGGAVTGALASGTLQITGVITEIGAIITAFGALAQVDGVSTLVDDGGNLLCRIANTLRTVINSFATLEFGGFMGIAGVLGLTGGVVSGVAASGVAQIAAIIAEIGAIITAFGALAQVEGIEKLVDDGGVFLSSIATALGGVLTAFSTGLGEAVSGFTEGLTSDLPQTGTNISDFITNAKPYIEAIAAMDSSISTKTGYLVDALLALVDLSIAEGFSSFIFGENNLVSFGQKLNTFSLYLKTAFSNFEGVDADTIQRVKDAIDSVEEIMEEFKVDGNIIDLVANMMDTASFTSFGERMGAIGSGLQSFYAAVKDDMAGIDSAVDTLGAVVDVIKRSPDLDASSLNTSLGDLGTAVSTFITNCGPDNTDKLDTAKDNIEGLKDMITTIGDFDDSGVSTFMTALDNLANECVTSFVNAFSSETANTTIESSVGTMLSYVVAAIAGSLENFKMEGQMIATNISNGISNAGDIVSGDVDILMSNLLQRIAFQFDAFAVAGSMLVVYLSSGIKKASSTASSAVSYAVNIAASVISNYYTRFYALGSYLVSGFANGISANSWRAAAQSRVMADNAYKAAQRALDSHSPSRKFFELGSFASIGLANGMKQYTNLVAIAGEGLGETAIDSTRNVLSNLGAMVEGNVDAQPVIRPVLDLSDVEYGARSLDTMFGYTNAGRIDFMMNEAIQNGGTNRVISALDDLSKRISNLEGTSNIYNINGITYDDGSNVSNAVESLIRAARVERRV